MAKKKTNGSKSDAVRAYLAKNGTAAGPNEIQAALAERGTNVSIALISKLKREEGGGRTKRKVRRKLGRKRAYKRRRAVRTAVGASSPLQDVKEAGDLMLHAVELVMKAGEKQAKHLVNVASEMVNKIRE